MLERLGIAKRFVLPFEQADGSVIDRDVGLAMLVINDTQSSMRVIFGEDDAESLIGSNALQEFLLLVDPVAEELHSPDGQTEVQRKWVRKRERSTGRGGTLTRCNGCRMEYALTLSFSQKEREH